MNAILESAWFGWPLIVIGVIIFFAGRAGSKAIADRSSIVVSGSNSGVNNTGKIEGNIEVTNNTSGDADRNHEPSQTTTSTSDLIGKATLFLGAITGFIGALAELIALFK